jgi:hypothetical protein
MNPTYKKKTRKRKKKEKKQERMKGPRKMRPGLIKRRKHRR